MIRCLEFRCVEPKGEKIEVLDHVWTGCEVGKQYTGFILPLNLLVYIFEEFHDRKSTKINKDYRWNFIFSSRWWWRRYVCAVSERLCCALKLSLVWDGCILWELTFV